MTASFAKWLHKFPLPTSKNAACLGTIYSAEISLPTQLLKQWWRFSQKSPYAEMTDDLQRMSTVERYANWLLTKNIMRRFYWQLDEKGNLLALAWITIGQKLKSKKIKLNSGINPKILEYNTTTAVRVFGELGRGTGTAFSSSLLHHAIKTYDQISGIWVSIKTVNAASLRMNQKLGFTIIGASSDGQTQYAVKPIDISA